MNKFYSLSLTQSRFVNELKRAKEEEAQTVESEKKK